MKPTETIKLALFLCSKHEISKRIGLVLAKINGKTGKSPSNRKRSLERLLKFAEAIEEIQEIINGNEET